jgi:hypothetical protein
MNINDIFANCAHELDQIVPTLAGRLVAVGQVEKYKHILLAAKAFRDALDKEATKRAVTASLDHDACDASHLVDQNIHDENAARGVLRHCKEITIELDAILALRPFGETITRQRTSIVYRAMAESFEEPVFLSFPHLRSDS